MPTPARPVAAALGLVPTVLSGVRRLPSKAAQLPVHAMSTALTGLGLARKEYDELARRGERLLAQLRGTSFDELEDKVEDALQGTPVAGLYDRLEDAAEDATEKVTALAPKARRNAAQAAKAATQQVREGTEALSTLNGAVQEQLPEAEAPKGAPTPKATQPDSTRIDSAASADVQAAVEEVASSTPVEVPSHDALPLPDYDHMTLGSLRGRLRSLSLEDLVALRAYEKAKADRLPVVTMLDNRIAKLAAGDAQPTGNVSAEPAPEQRNRARGGSKVSPATRGPKINPPNGGDPTNPSQPRSTG